MVHLRIRNADLQKSKAGEVVSEPVWCDACGEELREGEGPGLPTKCPGCTKNICESCEVFAAQQVSTCPFCGAMLFGPNAAPVQS